MAVQVHVGNFPSREKDQVWLEIKYNGSDYMSAYSLHVIYKHLPSGKDAFHQDLFFQHINKDSGFVKPLPMFTKENLSDFTLDEFASKFGLEISVLEVLTTDSKRRKEREQETLKINRRLNFKF